MPTPTPPPDWFQVPPAPEWQWAALVLTVIALGVAVMALPSVFQMWWGQPALSADFTDDFSNGVKFLRCEIKNRPIYSSVLRRMGVARLPAEDVLAKFAIREEGTNRVVSPYEAAMMRLSGSSVPPSQRVRLPGSTFPAVIEVVAKREGEAAHLNPFGGSPAPLAPGSYRCEVEVLTGTDVYVWSRGFFVGEARDDLLWTPD